MAKTDYTKMDALIVAAVRGGADNFTRILQNRSVREESDRIAGLMRDPMRIVDGRLQALRRRGALTYTSKAGWRIAENGNG